LRDAHQAGAAEDRMLQILARHPLKRIGNPTGIGATVAFLASPSAAFITGQSIVVDGGVTSQFGLADPRED